MHVIELRSHFVDYVVFNLGKNAVNENWSKKFHVTQFNVVMVDVIRKWIAFNWREFAEKWTPEVAAQKARKNVTGVKREMPARSKKLCVIAMERPENSLCHFVQLIPTPKWPDKWIKRANGWVLFVSSRKSRIKRKGVLHVATPQKLGWMWYAYNLGFAHCLFSKWLKFSDTEYEYILWLTNINFQRQ